MKTKQKKLQEAIKEFNRLYPKKTEKELKPTKEQLKEYPDCKKIISQDEYGNIWHYLTNNGGEFHIFPKTNLLAKYGK